MREFGSGTSLRRGFQAKLSSVAQFLHLAARPFFCVSPSFDGMRAIVNA